MLKTSLTIPWQTLSTISLIRSSCLYQISVQAHESYLYLFTLFLVLKPRTIDVRFRQKMEEKLERANLWERVSKFVEGIEKQRKPRASESQSVVQFHCGSAREKDDLTFNIPIEQVQNFTSPFIEPHFIRSFFLKNIHRSREMMQIPMLHFRLSVRTLQNRKYSTFISLLHFIHSFNFNLRLNLVNMKLDESMYTDGNSICKNYSFLGLFISVQEWDEYELFHK